MNQSNVFLRNHYQEENISKEHQFLFSCGSHIEERKSFGKAISMKGKIQKVFLNSSCMHIPIFSHKIKNT